MSDSALTVTAEMVDNLKITVIAFMTVEIVLALVAAIWVIFFSASTWAPLGPLFLFLYSLAALWIISHQWTQFKTKLAVLN